MVFPDINCTILNDNKSKKEKSPLVVVSLSQMTHCKFHKLLAIYCNALPIFQMALTDKFSQVVRKKRVSRATKTITNNTTEQELIYQICNIGSGNFKAHNFSYKH